MSHHNTVRIPRWTQTLSLSKVQKWFLDFWTFRHYAICLTFKPKGRFNFQQKQTLRGLKVIFVIWLLGTCKFDTILFFLYFLLSKTALRVLKVTSLVNVGPVWLMRVLTKNMGKLFFSSVWLFSKFHLSTRDLRWQVKLTSKRKRVQRVHS